MNQTVSGYNLTQEKSEWDIIIEQYGIRPLSRSGYYATGIYLLITGIIATIGNLMVLVMFARDRKLRRKPHNMLLLNLAISDFGVSLCGYPLTTASNFAQRYLFGSTGCIIQGFLTFTLALTDMNTLACLSVYRYITVCKPHYINKLDIKCTLRIIVFLWCYSFLWTVPPLLGWNSYIFEPFGTSCSIDWMNSEPFAQAYTWCLVLFCYLIHLITMIVCYFHVVRRTKELNISLDLSSPSVGTPAEVECCSKLHLEKHVTWMSVIMTSTFIILWTPYAFVCLWSVHDNTLPAWITTWPTMFAKASCMVNPVVYYMSNPLFRKCAKKLLCCEAGPTEIRPRLRYRVDRNNGNFLRNKETNQIETKFF
ncbi:hypothetical protein LOTGIDRAFT_156508 [Lottia gigantea]|uniref:G-protein coupled receptors family 1 profile domain-containing protein n=1 Tax=Lottia gigantea TaxID=225164 RepID=V4CNF1_LOTGI|nr:hypothetical protein LOTGIDRAFT_156508 [Lottia gigantea]ESP03910.1 hypothetical protein LOTGIDRAFT_156508 [Lottia gigantea]